MEKSVRRDSLMTTIALLFMVAIFGCGDLEAPYGSEVVVPSDTSIETASDVIFYLKAKVIDPNGNPMNGIDVTFLVCCEGGDIVDLDGNPLPTPITITTDEWGIAEVRVLVYADFEGDVIVSASSGGQGAQTIISKTILAE